MAVMFGNGKVDTSSLTQLLKTIPWTATTGSTDAAAAGAVNSFGGFVKGSKALQQIAVSSPTYYDANGAVATTFVSGEKYFTTGYVTSINAGVVEISPNTFPGTYYVTGDTYARSDVTGLDEYFQFVIPKAKMQSENTITLEAEGDPSVFNFNIKVLRPGNNQPMMKLVKYDIVSAG